MGPIEYKEPIVQNTNIKYYVIQKCIIRQLMETIHKVCKLTQSKVVQPLSMRSLSQSL